MASGTLEREAAPVREVTGFRPDVQGLRAVAVLVVLLYHAGAPFMPGGFVGVDIFFVISGFLITGGLLRQATYKGRIDIADFYARRVRRILPAATVVLIFVAIATLLVLPRTRWESIAPEIVGSAFYFVNWIFAANVNYLNATEAASPLQHFWTLAVEEQFYIVWPLLLVLVLYFARPRSGSGHGRSRRRIDPLRIRLAVQFGVLVITVPSLVWSVFYTYAAPGPAYFVTTTRLWELGVGAIVAVFAVYFERIPSAAGYTVGTFGLAAIAVSVLTYTPATPFPGYQALLPTLGAAGVIVGGMGGREARGVGALLNLRAMRWTGDISYSLYLWHWPLVVIGTYLLGGTLEFWQGLVIITIALLPAWLSYRFVETPFREWEYLKQAVSASLMAGLVLMIVSSLAGATLLLAPAPPSLSAPVQTFDDGLDDTPEDAPTKLGAELLAVDPTVGIAVDVVPGGFTPSAVDASKDNPAIYSDGCHQEENQSAAKACAYGDLTSDFVVALAGDSHAAQWQPALAAIATQNGWRLDTYTKSSCPVIASKIQLDAAPYDSCSEWNANLMATLTGANRPDFLILSAASYMAAPGEAPVADGYAQAWNTLKAAGLPYAIIEDVPRPSMNVPECVSANPETLTKCATPAAVSEDNGAKNQRRAAQATGDTLVDMRPYICPNDPCAAIIGNVLVYRDTNHLTATYATTLSAVLGTELREFTDLVFTTQ